MSQVLQQLDQILEARKQDSAEDSYVASLYAKGAEKILKKVAEESAETIMAAKDLAHNPQSQEAKDHLIYEVADLWFHTMVLLAHQGCTSQDITTELERRFGLSGLEEKANRKN